jgi:hypothetical protein
VDASEPNLDPGRLRTEEVEILKGVAEVVVTPSSLITGPLSSDPSAAEPRGSAEGVSPRHHAGSPFMR